MKALLLILTLSSMAVAQQTPPPQPAPAPAAAPVSPTQPPQQQPTPEPPPARLLEIKSVYLLKMARGLDQYLATELTRSGVFTVVTDPLLADAVLTDRVGKNLEEELATIYPKPSPKPAAGEQADSPTIHSDKPESTWGRGRGTIFLVDRTGRSLLWSTYMPSQSSRSSDVQKAAGKITEQLKSDLQKLRNPSKKGLFGM